jgi:hypothetical protein
VDNNSEIKASSNESSSSLDKSGSRTDGTDGKRSRGRPGWEPHYFNIRVYDGLLLWLIRHERVPFDVFFAHEVTPLIIEAV